MHFHNPLFLFMENSERILGTYMISERNKIKRALGL